jgi:integrase
MGRSADTDRRWLEMHYGKWRVTLSVPERLQKVVGASKLKQSLHTDSLAVANELKWSVIKDLKDKMRTFELAGKATSAGERARILREAADIAAHLRKYDPDDRYDVAREHLETRAAEILGVPSGYEMQAPGQIYDPEHVWEKDFDYSPVRVAVFDPEKELLAKQFYAVAMRDGIPIASADPDYKAKRLKVSPRTEDDHDRALTMLTAFCIETGRGDDVKAVDEDTVTDFVAYLENNRGLASRTIKKYVSRLSLYFDYLKSLRQVKINHWKEAVVHTPTSKALEEERPFSEQEVAALLMGPAKPVMMDLMMMGALTGARLNAIVVLKVRDIIENKAFRFGPQKRETRERYVPIHPDLMGIVIRRTEGKRPNDDFFPEYPQDSENPKIERSFRASKHFTTYRRSIGVDERVKGKRRGRVNFHSFRRWFITKGERTSPPEGMISALVGHAREGMTLGVYSEGPEMKAARRTVSKIKLPPLDGSPVIQPEAVTPKTKIVAWSPAAE